MTAAVVNLHSLTLTDVIVFVGVLGFIIDRLADAKGWSRSSRTLRRENEDLVRRNGELEQTVARHETELIRLRGLVDELQKRDQAAVLKALELHEANAAGRHERGETRHVETTGLLREIRDRLPKEER